MNWRHLMSVMGACLVAGCWIFMAEAGPLPSVFRGVVVADSPSGARVVSVEESSQAFLADLRPEDIIISIDRAAIRSIDEFATWSSKAKGQVTQAAVVIMRNGEPKELTVHLYSYPVLTHWDVAFVPEDLRFIAPRAGVDYWTRMARGHEIAKHPEAALHAYLNSLHNDPTSLEIAMKVSDLLWVIAQQQLAKRDVTGAIQSLEQETRLLKRLFEQQPMTDADLGRLKSRLEETVRVIRRSRRST